MLDELLPELIEISYEDYQKDISSALDLLHTFQKKGNFVMALDNVITAIKEKDWDTFTCQQPHKLSSFLFFSVFSLVYILRKIFLVISLLYILEKTLWTLVKWFLTLFCGFYCTWSFFVLLYTALFLFWILMYCLVFWFSDIYYFGAQDNGGIFWIMHIIFVYLQNISLLINDHITTINRYEPMSNHAEKEIYIFLTFLKM